MPLISDRTRITINLFRPQRRTPDPRHAIPQADRDLTGKTIVMTGGTDGIGRVAAGMLCDMGANLVLLGRRQAVGDRVIRELAATGGAGTVIFRSAIWPRWTASKPVPNGYSPRMIGSTF
ncbi:SDR family NAD(P)-dependent oxidoreductase [Sulfitobacter pontiacus]